jgi:hypothetical protein
LASALTGYIARLYGTFDFLFMPKDFSVAEFFASLEGDHCFGLSAACRSFVCSSLARLISFFNLPSTIECLPFLAFVGYGVYCLLTALVPSWREQNWKHWASYDEYVDPDSSVNINPWLRQLGFVKSRKPIAEGDLEENRQYRCITCWEHTSY